MCRKRNFCKRGGARARARRAKTYVSMLRYQDGKCGLCFGDLPSLEESSAMVETHPEKITLEHVYPLSVSEQDSLSNTVLAHNKCNRDKGSEEPSLEQRAFLAMVAARRVVERGIQRNPEHIEFYEKYPNFLEKFPLDDLM